jgi:signal transduction histidine kinase
MDISAGTTQTEQAADFPNGVPVASDASMSQWMSYVYQQQPLPTNFTGVTVQLSAIDPNGNHIVIGDATTNVDGVFDYTWTTPSVPGSYSVFATFAGTNGYYGSNANTGVDVVSAAATPAPTAAPPASNTNTYILASAIAIIIVLIIIGAVLMLMVRKRP